VSKTDEWALLKLQFDALAHEPSVDIEKLFDMEFHRRLGELINQIRDPSTQTWDIGSTVFHWDPLSE
jgi:hypothetical protein